MSLKKLILCLVVIEVARDAYSLYNSDLVGFKWKVGFEISRSFNPNRRTK